MPKPADKDPNGDFPAGIPKPALRALENAGYENLDQLAKVTKKDLAKLHGMGPKAIRILHEALSSKGKSFVGEDG